LRDLQPTYYVSIVDWENNPVYGQPISRSVKYFSEARFPIQAVKPFAAGLLRVCGAPSALTSSNLGDSFVSTRARMSLTKSSTAFRFPWSNRHPAGQTAAERTSL
jgi:hypothetical protein